MRETTRWKRPDDAELRQMLSDEQYEVMINQATERPFTSEHLANGREGIFVDAATGEPLFTSFDKFDSGTGWPSFTRPIAEDAVTTCTDTSAGMVRTEVRSASGDMHLGHVFNDGPADRGGMRYCINGVALRFVPIDDLEKEGYGHLLPEMHERRKYEPHKNPRKRPYPT